MAKKLGAFLVVPFICSSVMAGGLSTNTAANASYLRFFSQEANIDIASLYANPAGTAFLKPGWHIGLSTESVFQKRLITTGISYPLSANASINLLEFNPKYNADKYQYEGKAIAPFVPALDLSYNTDGRWSFNLHLGMIGGGGACEFSDGLGTFDALFAGQMLQTALTQAVVAAAGEIMANEEIFGALQQQVIGQCIAGGITDPAEIQEQIGVAVQKQATQAVMANAPQLLANYRATNDGYMKGSNYMYGLQIGATYKALDNLSLYLAVRGVYNHSNYNGYIQDTEYSVDGGITYTPLESVTNRDNVLSMNCEQIGFGISPVVGVHWKINDQWNVAAKYEFKTRVRLKNETRMNSVTRSLATETIIDGQPNYAYSTMAQFADGASVPDDMPGLLGVGVQYSPIKSVKMGLSGHWIQEKKATKFGNHQKLHDNDTYELLASVEWRCHEKLALSCGWQGTSINMSDVTLNDINYSISSNSIGCGFRFYASERVNIDFGYMYTLYIDRDVVTTNWMSSGLTRTDTYSRKNQGFGLAVNFAL